MVIVVGVGQSMGQEDFPHPHGDEAEGGGGILGILRPTVMTAVWVVPGGREVS